MSLRAPFTLVSLSLFALAGTAQAQPRPQPAEPAPGFAAAIPAGFQVDARWELGPDAGGVPLVLVHMTRRAEGVADEHRCGVLLRVNNAWQLSASDSALAENPQDCLSAVRVDNRWVVGRWTLGGSGEGRNAANDSSLELFAVVGGALRSVGSLAVTQFGALVGGTSLSLWTAGTVARPLAPLVWNADHTRLGPRAPAPRR